MSLMTQQVLKTLVVIGALLLGMGDASAQVPLRSRAAKSARPAVHFPLAVGNRWTYIETGRFASGRLDVSVTESRGFNHQEYFRLVGYAGEPAWVRMTADDQLVAFDPDTSLETVWYDFGAEIDVPWRSGLPLDCTGEAQITSKPPYADDTVAQIAPAFLTIQYGPTQCADAGLVEEIFVPSMGMVRRVSQSIAGPRTLSLAHAQVGGRVIGSSGLTVSLTLSQAVYVADLEPPVDVGHSVPTLNATLTIRNTTDSPVKIVTATGQQFDFEIRDANGTVVYRWSDGKFFTQALTNIDLSPGERNFSIEVPLGEEGVAFPAGSYTIEGWVTGGAPKRYSATSGFELVHAL